MPTDAEIYAAIQADATAKALAAAGSDAACAARLNAITPPVFGVTQGMVSATNLLVWGASSGARQAIEQGISSAVPGVPSACLAVRDLLAFGGAWDSANPTNQQLVTALVTAGVLTSGQGQSLLALGQSPVIVSGADVSRAMAPYRPNGKVSN